MKQGKFEDRLQMRRLTTDDTAQYNALLRYAFQVTDSELASLGWNQKDMERSKKPVLRKTESFGFFDGDKLASQISIYPMSVNIFGEMYKMGGVTGVATYPEYMGRGLMSRLMKQALDNMRENHQCVSMLVPYMIPYYPLEAINKELSRHESNSQQAIIMELSCEESCCSAGNNQAAEQAGIIKNENAIL